MIGRKLSAGLFSRIEMGLPRQFIARVGLAIVGAVAKFRTNDPGRMK